VLRLRGEIETQLGIKLHRTNAEIPTLVVERAERPTED
jgi:uncharacterized protein (TIGR03435 family)